MMRKSAAFLLMSVIMLSVPACGNQGKEGGNGGQLPAADSEILSGSMEETEDEGLTGQTRQPEEEEPQENVENTKGGNILIAYFSRWGNTEYPDDVDASTSASIVMDGETYGTTEYVANLIRQNVGGDIYRIETVTPYTEDFDELRDVNHNEMEQGILPELKESGLDVSAYDTIFVGYPVWATDVPQAVLSFLNEYDLSGKTVIPFCTHDGYGAGSSYRTIAEASHGAVSLDGIAVGSEDVLDAQDDVADWLTSIGVTASWEQGETPIQITVGGAVLEGVLYDTPLAQEIKGYFPLTVSMTGYGGREYYGGVDFYPENLEGGQRNFENGDITYCEAHHNMAVFYAQTENPDLSVDVIPIGKVTSDLSIFDSLDGAQDITFSIKQSRLYNFYK